MKQIIKLNENQLKQIVLESVKQILKEETWQSALHRGNVERARELFGKKHNFKGSSSVQKRDEEPFDGIDTESDVTLKPDRAYFGRTTKYNPDPDANILSTDKWVDRDGTRTITYHGGVPNSDFEWEPELEDYYTGEEGGWHDRMNQKRKKLGNYGMPGLDKPIRKPKKRKKK